jgi:hypothetical protein
VHAVLRDRESTPSSIVDRLSRGGVPVTTAVEVTPSLEDVFLDVVETAEAHR